MATLTRITPSGPGYATAAECKAAIIAEVGKAANDAGGRPLPFTSNYAHPCADNYLSVQYAAIEAGWPLLPRLHTSPSYPVDTTFLNHNDAIADVAADGLPVLMDIGGIYVTGDLCGYGPGPLGATLPTWDDYTEADTGECVLARPVSAGTPVSGALAGTYSQSGTVITVNFVGHGRAVGNSVYLDFTSGTAVDGTYTVATVSSTGNSFTVVGASASTSGTVRVQFSGANSAIIQTGFENFYRTGRPCRFQALTGSWAALNSGTYTIASTWNVGTTYFFSIAVDASSFGAYGGGGESVGRTYQMGPWGSSVAWEDLGEAHATSVQMDWFQAQYPNPPRVLYWSNDEFQLSTGNNGSADYSRCHYDPRYRALYADYATRTEAQRMADLGNRLITQYGNFWTSFTTNLTETDWQNNIQHVGYSKGLTYNFKDCTAWYQWQYGGVLGNSLADITWYHHVYNGSSAEIYDDKNDSDVLAFKAINSMQNLAMVSRFYRGIVEGIDPDYWYEGIVWDGYLWGTNLLAKGAYYTARGITYTPEYYKGWTQYCLWIMQPRQWRCFNDDDLSGQYGEDWQVIKDQVAHVHSDATLQRFWRSGTLVENPAVITASYGGCTNITHPYQAVTSGSGWDYSATFCGYPKNYHLTTSLDTVWGSPGGCPRTSTEDTNHLRACWTLAYLLGTAPTREWLIYAHSTGISGSTLTNVVVTIPSYGDVTLPEVPVEGAFYGRGGVLPVIRSRQSVRPPRQRHHDDRLDRRPGGELLRDAGRGRGGRCGLLLYYDCW